MNKLVESLKSEGEDFEFYPTTNEIIQVMLADFQRPDASYDYRKRCIGSFLDIGAGDGKVLRAVAGHSTGAELYAIEKSIVLCAELSKFAYVVGTDFHAQTLLTKQFDVTFCNPPYSEYEQWMTRIIRESASARAYMVIPDRWKSVPAIADALKYRDAEYSVLGSFDFENSEDRRARAHVHLVRIDFGGGDDAFERFFNEEFAGLKERYAKCDLEKKQTVGARAEIVKADNFVEAMVTMYEKEMEKTRHNYSLAAALDVDLLRELQVSPANILACLRTRVNGLKNQYWSELFDRMKEVTNRLCKEPRSKFLKTLNENAHVDFTLDNIYAVLLWIINHANEYMEEQLMDLFDGMISKANVRNYKSNSRVFEFNRWRYNQESPTHVSLEYRLVLENQGGLASGQWSWERGLSERACDFIRDFLAVAYNLGYICDTQDSRLYPTASWSSGRAEVFEYTEPDGSREQLLEVKAFKNGNLHIRMNQKFALALNVENGRLRGWLVSPQEAAEELGDPLAAAMYGKQARLGAGSLKMLESGGTRERERL